MSGVRVVTFIITQGRRKRRKEGRKIVEGKMRERKVGGRRSEREKEEKKRRQPF